MKMTTGGTPTATPTRSMPTATPGAGANPFYTEPLPKDAPMSGPDIDLSDMASEIGLPPTSRPDGKVKVNTIDANDLRKKAKETDPFKTAKESGNENEADDDNADPTPVDGISNKPTAIDKPTDDSDDTSLEIGAPEVEEEKDKETSETAEDKAAPTAVTKPEKKGRDYSQFIDPDVAEIARKLPNDLFAKLEVKAKEWAANATEVKQLKETLAKSPSVAYEHESGYVLDPVWGQMKTAFGAYQFEQSHWDAQIDKINAGESWQNFRGFDKDGNPVLETIAAPADGIVDKRSLKAVERAYNKASADLDRTQDAASQFINTHKQRVEGQKNEIAEIKKKLFPKLHDVSKFSPEDKASYNLAGSLLPAYYRDHPLADFNKLSYVNMTHWAKGAEKLAKENMRLKAALAGRKLSQNVELPTTEGEDKPVGGGNISLKELAALD